MKRVRRNREFEYVPALPPEVAVFLCRACGAKLTGPLQRLDDSTKLTLKELEPLVPVGTYWLVEKNHLPTSYGDAQLDFTGNFAVNKESLIDVNDHPDLARWNGCCGSSGNGGPNRICKCKYVIGTERSDCMWPIAVYLDPNVVSAVVPEAEMTSG